ncbi:MAG: NAD-dependent epimerase/dehydratase family protein [Planctomycetes bacterium]|nr:NAD-dependent epimerase/dehydratase family protein [Planctomycetota bacterium]
MITSRRAFLQTSAAGSLLALTGPAAARAAAQETGPAPASGEAREKLNLLILGGTVLLGPATVRAALARGHNMTLFNRGKTNADLFPELEKLHGDRETGDLASLAGRTWDAVIDTSGYVPAHVAATAALVAPSARQYVFLSSCSVYADHSVRNDETSPVIEVTDDEAAAPKTIRESLANYGGMKARCERVAEEAMPGRVTAIRPGLIIGPDDISDRFTYWAVRVARGGEVLAPGDGSDPVQLVDARDLGAWIIHCVEESITGTFNAVSPAGRWNMAEMLCGVKAAFSCDARFTWVDAEFLAAQGVAPWTDLPVWLPAEGEHAAFHLVSTEKAVAAGLTFRPLAESARDTVAWHDATRPGHVFGRSPGRAGLKPEREAELLEAWRRHLADKPAPAAEKPE